MKPSWAIWTVSKTHPNSHALQGYATSENEAARKVDYWVKSGIQAYAIGDGEGHEYE